MLSAMSNPSFLGDVDMSCCCKRLLAKKKRAILFLNSIDLTARETNYLITFRSNLISRHYGVAGRCLRNLVIERGRFSNVCSIKLKKLIKSQEATNLRRGSRLLEMGVIHKFSI